MEIADAASSQFSSVDYAVFLVLLLIPSSIGIYFAFKDWKNGTTSKYFFGERKLHPIAVGISTAVTSISAITMIGYPSEVYLVGTVYFWAPVVISLAALVTIVYYIPFYDRLEMDTVYEYLELRYNRWVRRIVAFTVSVSEIFYMGTIVYIPSLALSAVSPISVNVSIAITGGICTFYTTLGGMKAVVWIDVVQSTLMFAASLAVLICGIVHIGGVDKVTAALERGQRLTHFDFEFDSTALSSRMSPIAILVGEFFMYNQYLAFSQPVYQRIRSCKNVKQSRYSVVVYLIPALCIILVAIANGFLMYAYFEGCDPLKSGLLTSRDQGMPYIALQLFSSMPGLSGVYVSAVFSGSLSSVSSGINANSAVIVRDFASVIVPGMKEKTKLFISKISALILGVVVVSVAYVASLLGSNVFKLMRCFMGAFGGPSFGIYLLGIFFPWVNSTGAIVGAAASYLTMLWIFLGSAFLQRVQPPVQLPPISTDGCPLQNQTYMNATTPSLYELSTTHLTTETYTFDQMVYSLNFHYYYLAGALITIAVGLPASFVTGMNKPSNTNPKVFMPVVDNKYIPASIRKFFRCGVPELDEESNADCEHCEMHPLKA